MSTFRSYYIRAASNWRSSNPGLLQLFQQPHQVIAGMPFHNIEPSTVSATSKASNHNPEKILLERHIDPDYGLLDKLLGNGTLSYDEYTAIRDKGTRLDKNQELLKIVTMKNRYDQLLDTLKEDGQSHVTNFGNKKHASTIDEDLLNDNLPLTIMHENTIDLNRYILVDLITGSSKLADKLYKKLVFNERQRDHVCDLHATRANEVFLDILRRKSIHNYKATVRCLRQVNQGLAADILDGQVIGIIRCQIDNDENEDGHEDILAEALNNRSHFKELTKCLDLHQMGLKLVKHKPGVLLLYFRFESADDISRMRQSVDNHRLKNLLQKLIIELLHLPEESMITVTTHWSADDIARCVQCARRVLPMKFKEFPLEIFDMILKKMVHQLMFRDKVNVQSIFTTLASIDKFWLERMSNSSVKRRISTKETAYFRKLRKRSAIIRNNEGFLKEVMQPECIIDLLRTMGCLTENEVTSLRKIETVRGKNEELLFLLQRFSSKNYWKFLECLVLTNQESAAIVLQMGGEVVRVTVASTTGIPINNLALFKNLENEISVPFKSIGIPCNLGSNDIVLLRANQDRGTVIWFWCKTEAALKELESKTDTDFLAALQNLRSVTHSASIELLFTIDRYHRNREFEKRRLYIQAMGNCQIPFANEPAGCVTSLDDRIYVTQGRRIFVYENKYPYNFLKPIELNPSRIRNAISIASCNINKYLYVFDPADECIFKVEPEFGNRKSVFDKDRGLVKMMVTSKGHVGLFVIKNVDPSSDYMEKREEYSLLLLSVGGRVEREISMEPWFRLTESIQEIIPGIVALSYKIPKEQLNVVLELKIPKELPNTDFFSCIAIMRLDDKATVLHNIVWQREIVCLSSFHYFDLLFGEYRNKCAGLHHWFIESKAPQYFSPTEGVIEDIHFAADQRQLFVLNSFKLNIYQLKYEDEADD